MIFNLNIPYNPRYEKNNQLKITVKKTNRLLINKLKYPLKPSLNNL